MIIRITKAPLIFLSLSALALSSCGLLRSAVQLPVRTLGGVTRAAGLRLQVTEYQQQEAPAEKQQDLAGDSAE